MFISESALLVRTDSWYISVALDRSLRNTCAYIGKVVCCHSPTTVYYSAVGIRRTIQYNLHKVTIAIQLN